MSTPEKKPVLMTYKQYATWSEGQKCEVLDGEIISMAPSPTPEHQSISMQLSIEFGTYLRGKECRVFAASTDVYLFEDYKKEWIDEHIKNWVIPDLFVVCDHNKIQKNKIVGPPDLVIEIISPSTAKVDRMDKRLAYQRAGVKEYWIVDPANQLVEVYLLKNGTLELYNVYGREDSVKVQIFKELIIELKNIFEGK